MLQRAGEFAQQLEIGGAGDNAHQQRRNARQREESILARTDIAEQMRHQVVEHLTSTRAKGALIQLFTKVSNQRQHAHTIVICEMRQHRRCIILLQGVLP